MKWVYSSRVFKYLNPRGVLRALVAGSFEQTMRKTESGIKKVGEKVLEIRVNIYCVGVARHRESNAL